MRSLLHYFGYLLVIALAIPLAFGLVQRNSWYGIRTARTLADPELWSRANVFGGWALILGSVTSAALIYFVLRPTSGPLTEGAIIIGPLLVAALAIVVYIKFS